MRCYSHTIALLALLAITTSASAQIIVSEIMYNPASKEDFRTNLVEWVELYNPTDQPIDVSGWFLQDEDGKTAGLPRNTTIKAGQAIVLIPGALSVEKFRAAWGEGFDVYPVTGWDKPGITGLGNNPSEKNELLTLRKADGSLADEAHYKIDGDWPKPPRGGGASLILKPGSFSATANDDGKNWVYADAGKLGAKNNTKTEEFNGKDTGSPGIVAKE